MKKSLLFALGAAAATLIAAPQAQARDRCGTGYHRAHGRCIPNHRARRPALVIGHYYQGRGWWDGRRYYRHHYMHRGHWRYR